MSTNDSVKTNNLIQEYIPKEAYDDNKFMDLDNNYTMTVAELGLQQSKRDQIIAFYLTVLGLVIPNIVTLEIPSYAKSAAFLVLYIIGMMLCFVIMRYRVYKEVYWIACRVITQLGNIKESHINERTIHTLYYNALKKNKNSIIADKRKSDGTSFKKISKLKSFYKQLNSAETLLFEILVIFSTFVGIIGAFYAFSFHWVASAIIAVFLLFEIIYINYQYCTRLIGLYKCIYTQSIKDLMIPFNKAWMLHCYVDDITFSEDAKIGHN